MGRTRNAFRNLYWGVLYKIITLVIPFITRTVLIKILGAEYLGLSSLFTSILGLLSLAELGISDAIVSSMYKPIAEKDTETICALMNLFKKAYYTIGTFIAVIGLAICPYIERFIHGEVPNDINVYVLYLIFLSNTVVSYFLFAYKNCLFIAHQRNDINSKVQTVCRMAQSIFQIVLVLFFRNFYCYAIVIPVSSICINLITAYIARKQFPEYVCRGNLKKETYADVKKRVVGLMIGKTSSTIRSSIDSLFISAFLGLITVAMYSNYFYVVTAVAGIIQVLESSLVAGIGNSIVSEPVQKNYKDFLVFTFMLQWVVGWCSICILCLEQPFMELWVGKELMFSDLMVVLCANYLFINCICIIRSAYTQALGMWWELKYLSIVDVGVNIFLNYVGVKFFGAYGIIGATVLDILIVSIPWATYYLFKGYFGRRFYKEYVLGYLTYYICFIVVGVVAWGVCKMIPSVSPLRDLLIRLMICVFVPNVLYYLLFLRTELFREAKQFVQKKLINYT